MFNHETHFQVQVFFSPIICVLERRILKKIWSNPHLFYAQKTFKVIRLILELFLNDLCVFKLLQSFGAILIKLYLPYRYAGFLRDPTNYYSWAFTVNQELNSPPSSQPITLMFCL